MTHAATKPTYTVETCKQQIIAAAKSCIAFERGAQLAEQHGDTAMAADFRRYAAGRSADGFKWAEFLRVAGAAA
ncbi:hypothetical protein KR767_04175 [Luteibacter anthropi]|uniref:hypothetical protein n=1 Tax=Luteibacter anthropi TaxID=564369 RepID=UPI0020323749|nr:hypothetical protein [Luteibacter anthropi]URX63274.1 hypothetical protein KR767_04175 [Luteibacter anthropi]